MTDLAPICAPEERNVRFLNILVAYDGSPPGRAALEHAYEVARTQNSKVTVVTVAPPVARFAALGGVSTDGVRAELDEWASRTVRDAAEAAPDGVIVHTVQRRGKVATEVVAEIQAGCYDLVVLGSRGHGRIRSEILGSVTAHVHFHSHIPMLSICES
jgi:nucleotide-binding universal stress UspA family protein